MIRISTNDMGDAFAVANLALVVLAITFPALDPTAMNLYCKLNSPALLLERLIMGEFARGIISLPLMYLQWQSICGLAHATAPFVERKLTQIRLK